LLGLLKVRFYNCPSLCVQLFGTQPFGIARNSFASGVRRPRAIRRSSASRIRFFNRIESCWVSGPEWCIGMKTETHGPLCTPISNFRLFLVNTFMWLSPSLLYRSTHTSRSRNQCHLNQQNNDEAFFHFWGRQGYKWYCLFIYLCVRPECPSFPLYLRYGALPIKGAWLGRHFQADL
jgi:hypothetical protein